MPSYADLQREYSLSIQSLLEQSGVWQDEQKRIQDTANLNRSEAAKGNDNAAKEKSEKTVLPQSVVALNDHRKGAEAIILNRLAALVDSPACLKVCSFCFFPVLGSTS